MESVDTVVVGAGQAGIAVSHLLSRAGVSHVVFERGRVGESWRSQRWDSFALNTPNWSNVLPGAAIGGADGDAFAHRDDLVEFFERYVAVNAVPVRGQTAVTSVEQSDGGGFRVDTETDHIEARNVVVCSGSMSTARIPAMADHIDGNIATLTAATYKNAEALPDGAVVVVGSGQSGCQIVEDLLGTGRKVYLCVSKVARIPRRYRGRDILSWWAEMGFLDVRVDELADPNAQYAAQPQVSGTRGGHTISLQSLARDGATLVGRVEGIDASVLRLGPSVADCVVFADQKCDEFKAAIDRYIIDQGIDAPAAVPDPYEPAMPDLNGSDTLQELDLRDADVSTIIWCVGFGGDFSWIRADILDERGLPRHHMGVSDIPGLYFVGFPWLRKRKSGILYGVGEDARHVVERITADS